MTTHLKSKGVDIYVEWIPGHCGIKGNEMADFHAKAALVKKIEVNNNLNMSEMKSLIITSSKLLWQERWNKTNSYLKTFQKDVNEQYICSLERQHSTIIHRLRFGVLGLNQDLLRLKIHATGFCNRCPSEIETVKHFLVHCPNYIIERAMFLTEINESQPEKIMEYLKKSESNIQRAIVRFVHRTKRFPIRK